MLSGLLDITKYLPYLSLAIYAIAAIVILVAGFRGWRNGISRQVFRSIMVVAAAGLALFATDRIAVYLLSLCDGKNLWELFELTKIPTIFKINEATIETLKGMDTELVAYVLPLFVPFLTMPIVFTLLFIVLNAVLRLFFKIFAGIGGLVTYKHSDTNRFVASLIGLAQGVLVAMILALPLAGAVNVAHESIAAIQEEDPGSASTVAITEKYDRYVKPFDTNFLLTYTYQFGGNRLIDHYSESTVNGKTIDMKEETVSLLRIYAQTTVFDKETKWSSLNAEEEAAITAITNQVSEDDYLALVVSGVLRAGSSVLNEKVVKNVDIQEPFATLLSSILGVFETSDENNLHGDLTTVKNVYFILSDGGILTAMSEGGDITSELAKTDAEGKTVISKVISELNLNGRTKAITDSLTDISFAILLKQTGMDSEAMEEIKAVKEDVSDTLNTVLALNEENYANHEAYVYAISNNINGTLKEHDISLDNATLNQIASYVADPENFCDADGNRITEVSDTELTEFLLSYYDAYAAQNQTAE